MNGQREPVALVPLTKEEGFIPLSSGWKHLFLLSASFYFPSVPFLLVPRPPLMLSNSSSCTILTTEDVAIQPPSDGAEERAIVSPGPHSCLSINWKGENSRDWFPHRLSLLGRTSGSVREAGTLCCPAAVSFQPFALPLVLKCPPCPPALLLFRADFYLGLWNV